MKLCKDCKHLMWYKWWWPYFMGIAKIEYREECDHPKNHKRFHDAITGEDSCAFGWLRSPHSVNEKGNCKWYEPGRHERNFNGEMSPEDKRKLDEYHAESNRPRRRKWLGLW